MARSIASIKNEMLINFMADENLANRYGFSPGANFDDTFSVVSLENIMLSVVATAIYTIESLFDLHREEITLDLDSRKPHGLKWYREKVLSFQFGRSLQPESDIYDVVVPSEKVVKYAAVNEFQGRLFIKVAGGSDTSKQPLSNAQQIALEYYLNEVRDAGVQIGPEQGLVKVTNLNADCFKATINIYYNPMVFDSTGVRLDNGASTVRDTITDYVQNRIPFNGEYRNDLLIDLLQQLDGVVIPHLVEAGAKPYDSTTWQNIHVRDTPVSGYYKVYNEADLQLNFIVYQTTEV